MYHTEADEASHGDRLVALANLRYQVISDETYGVIDMYAIAAVRCGVEPSAAWKFVRSTRDSLAPCASDDDRNCLLFALCDSTQDYLQKRLDASAYACAIGVQPSLLS